MANTKSRRGVVLLVGGGAAAAVVLPMFAGQGHYSVTSAYNTGLRRSYATTPEEQFETVPLRETDYVLGVADAPVTLIKYGSLTCPHCAAFHIGTVAELKRNHIPNGQVRYIHRHFPLNQPAMAAAMLLYSGDGSTDQFYSTLDILYREQRDWAGSPDYLAALYRVARRVGVIADEFDASLTDQSLLDRIVAEREEGSQTYGVNATPTLLVNGGRYSGNLGIAQLDAIFAQVL